MTKRSRHIFWALLASLVVTLSIGGAIIIRRTHDVEAACLECARRGFHVRYSAPSFNWLDERVPGHEFLRRPIDVWLGESQVVCWDLNVSGKRTSDEDWQAVLPALRKMPSVTHVLFGFDPEITITGQTLELIAQFPDLQNLALTGAEAITDEDLAALSGHRKLRVLALDSTNISGEGLEALENLPNLQHLSLDGTPLTEEGVLAIGKLKNLKSISLSNTGIPESVIRELEKQLPGVMISDD